MSTVIRWTLFNAFLIGALAAGFSMDMPGIRNVAIFLIWVMFALSLLMLLPGVLEKVIEDLASKDKTSEVPRVLRNIAAIITVSLLVWFGAFWTAGAYIVAFALMRGLSETINKRRDEKRGLSPEIQA